MKRKTFLHGLSAIAALAALPLAGCGGSDAAEPPAPPAPPPTGTAPPPPGSVGGTPPAAPAPSPPPGLPAEPAPPPAAPLAKSAKRGIAYDVPTDADLTALSPGVSWWYNWSPRPAAAVSIDTASRLGMDFVPMLWNGDFNDASIVALLKARPSIQHLLLMNEPNLTDQANLTPQQAAAVWPRYEAIAAQTGVKLVGPAITWGTLPGYQDPAVWLDAFIAAYKSAHAGRAPRIDALGFHWYDYGLAGQLDVLARFGKPFWVTEFANWHAPNDGARIDTVEKQKRQMTEMVNVCETRADVHRYAWFTGRWTPDPHHTSLLAANGALTELGRHYLSLPYGTAP